MNKDTEKLAREKELAILLHEINDGCQEWLFLSIEIREKYLKQTKAICQKLARPAGLTVNEIAGIICYKFGEYCQGGGLIPTDFNYKDLAEEIHAAL